ncbi:hypothetical protein [Ornithobacterium rhinotracheale]|uniref:hypothetical protein n=1 Tax=Ornithobacterium rhinotracheale TaxID=28251 RepID=UPI001FF267A5|nr:hypothetical protein [Ornithobacterium rhinotracheale]MCK0199105.1 hypothetical protein [Ornithobacterium rhinotracheale]
MTQQKIKTIKDGMKFTTPCGEEFFVRLYDDGGIKAESLNALFFFNNKEDFFKFFY